MFWIMSWRNIWRNPRRTAVILIAITTGVFAMITSTALMRGFEKGMIERSLSTLTGELQIHHPGYLDDPVVDNSMKDVSEIKNAIEDILPGSVLWTARIRVNSIVSNARHSGGVTLVGIDPVKEARISFIGDAVTQGKYLEADHVNSVIAGRAFVEQFETELNKKLILMTRAMDGNTASRAFRISAIFDAELESTEKGFLFILKSSAQDMLKMGSMISEVALITGEEITPEDASARISKRLGNKDYSIKTWKDLKPVLVAYMGLIDGFTYIWYIIIFVAMGFGIVNTILMAVFERIREFGIFKALGMKPGWIVKQVTTESLILLVLGTVAGNLIALLAIWSVSGGIDLSAFAEGMEYAGFTRIIYPWVQIRDIFIANITVFILGILVSLYPAVKAARFTPVDALTYN